MQGKVSRNIVNDEMYISCKGVLNYKNIQVLDNYLNSNSELKLILDLHLLEKIDAPIARLIFNKFESRYNKSFIINSNKIVYEFLQLIGMNKFISIIRSESFAE